MTNTQILEILKERFENNKHRHLELNWENIEERLTDEKLIVLAKMEETGGEPDVVGYDKEKGQYLFFDCSKETPSGRKNTCYDREGEEKRIKKNIFPSGNVIDMAKEIGIEVLDEEQYFYLQSLEEFDCKTSSWIKTEDKLRKLGGAIFGDCRYKRTFIYHNGADSFYGARGFRGLLRV